MWALLTKFKILYAIISCLFFGFMIGSLVYLIQWDNVCTTALASNLPLCYTAVGAVAGAMALVAWPFLPTFGRAYVSLLMPTSLGTVLGYLILISAYFGAFQVGEHVLQVLKVPLKSGECFFEEAQFTFKLLNRAINKDSHVEQMTAGIGETADSFKSVSDLQSQLVGEARSLFSVLAEVAGLACRAVVQGAKEPVCFRENVYFANSCPRNLSACQETHMSPYPSRNADACLPFNDNQKIYTTGPDSMETLKGWNMTSCAGYYNNGVQAVDLGSLIYNGLCWVVKFVFDGICSLFDNKAIVAVIDKVIKAFLYIVSELVKFRLAFKLKVVTSNNVEQELKNAFSPVTDGLNVGSAIIAWIIDFIYSKKVLLAMVIWILVFPVWYLIRYHWSMSYDNRSIPDDEVEKERAFIQEREAEGYTVPDDQRLFPLQYGTEETTKYIMCHWIPWPRDLNVIRKELWAFFTRRDIVIVIVLLLLDYGLTYVVNYMYEALIRFFNLYQGKIFDIIHDTNPQGLKRLFQFFIVQLDKLQQAAGLSRFVACAFPAPPINYSYALFLYALVMRVAISVYQAKWTWIPSMVLRHYYAERHEERMADLRERILATRPPGSYQEDDEAYPWLRDFFDTCGCSCTVQTPRWLLTLRGYLGMLHSNW